MDAQFDQKILFEMLRDIDQAEMSGVLELYTGKDSFSIYFQSGFVIYAVEKVNNTGESMEFSKRQALHLARVSHGRFNFNGAAESPVINDWQLRAADLILEAARLTSNEDTLSAELGDPDRQMVGPVFNIDERTRGLLLTPTEFSVLSQLEVPLTIGNLINSLGLPAIEVMRCIYALCSAGVLDYPTPFDAGAEDEAEFTYPVAAETMRVPPATSRVAMPNRAAVTSALPSRPVAAAMPMGQSHPVATPVHSSSPATAQSDSAAERPAPSKPRSKLNTGALQKLAGIKIRSMNGDSEKESTTTPESEKYYQQGYSAMRSGNIANAEIFLRKAHSLVPNYVPYMVGLGRLLSKMPKRQKEAENLLMQACSEDMEALEPRMLLVELYEALGMKAKVETMLKSALHISPDYKPALNKLAELNKGSSWGDFFRWKK